MIGGRGISEVYFRILVSIGIRKIGLLSSSYSKTRFNSDTLHEKFGIKPISLTDWNAAKSSFKPDGVIIASSNITHNFYVSLVLSDKIPVLCEKPLLWQNNYSKSAVGRALGKLENLKHTGVFLNTSNRFLIRPVIKLIKQKINDISKFNFFFNTHGGYKYDEIAVDLLPHALSVLHEAFGFKRLCNIKKNIKLNCSTFLFKYGKLEITFELAQDESKDKNFYFQLDNQKFIRKQIGKNETYEVYIEDTENSISLKIEDPFVQQVKIFLSAINKEICFDDWELAKWNMNHMVDLLL